MEARGIEILGAGKSFGAFRALDDVSLKIQPGTVHALLGENGAGKSTLVKGVIGYAPLDTGQILVDEREVMIHHPRQAYDLNIGMVYQHFTVAPGMTVAENLLLARGRLPMVIRWRREMAELNAFMQRAPFQIPLDALVGNLAAGEKQKLEILKQLYLKHRFLILDEPTSVLTVQEADDVLGLLRAMAHRGEITVLMITHKFGEVLSYCDEVTVLRRGRKVASASVAECTRDRMAEWIMGTATLPALATKTRQITSRAVTPRLDIAGLCVLDDRGVECVKQLSLQVHGGEIVGLAGISGNGQKELIETLLGQRAASAGTIKVAERPYSASRAQMRDHQVCSLPEEPLHNATVARLSVAENLALRNFDRAPVKRAGFFISRSQMRARAQELIDAFNVRPPDPLRAVVTLSGGNVQRAVLARELSEPVELLIVANPVFGLDFKAVADIHGKLLEVRDRGAAVLLASDDLDELLELADRILVISGGEIVYEVAAATADRAVIGSYMAGHGHDATVEARVTTAAAEIELEPST